MRRNLTLVTAALALLWSPLNAQSRSWDPTGLQLTRPELEQMLELYERAAASGSTVAREEADLIRRRLSDGDLQAGDRIVLAVEGHTELTDTFSVNGTRSIVLPEIGAVPLGGVLRSELETYMRDYLGRFIREPVVHTRSLVRVEISGAVARPGFYAVPSDMLISDALMLAGGPTSNAELEKITIHRGDEEISSVDRTRDAIVSGRTIDQLSMRAGDGIRVPERGNRFETVRNVGLVITGAASLVALLLQVF